jgi:hypothetical protein
MTLESSAERKRIFSVYAQNNRKTVEYCPHPIILPKSSQAGIFSGNDRAQFRAVRNAHDILRSYFAFINSCYGPDKPVFR